MNYNYVYLSVSIMLVSSMLHAQDLPAIDRFEYLRNEVRDNCVIQRAAIYDWFDLANADEGRLTEYIDEQEALKRGESAALRNKFASFFSNFSYYSLNPDQQRRYIQEDARIDRKYYATIGAARAQIRRINELRSAKRAELAAYNQAEQNIEHGKIIHYNTLLKAAPFIPVGFFESDKVHLSSFAIGATGDIVSSKLLQNAQKKQIVHGILTDSAEFCAVLRAYKLAVADIDKQFEGRQLSGEQYQYVAKLVEEKAQPVRAYIQKWHSLASSKNQSKVRTLLAGLISYGTKYCSDQIVERQMGKDLWPYRLGNTYGLKPEGTHYLQADRTLSIGTIAHMILRPHAFLRELSTTAYNIIRQHSSWLAPLFPDVADMPAVQQISQILISSFEVYFYDKVLLDRWTVHVCQNSDALIKLIERLTEVSAKEHEELLGSLNAFIDAGYASRFFPELNQWRNSSWAATIQTQQYIGKAFEWYIWGKLWIVPDISASLKRIVGMR